MSSPTPQRILGHTANIRGSRDRLTRGKLKDPGQKANHASMKGRVKEYDGQLAIYRAQWQALTPEQRENAATFLLKEYRQTRPDTEAVVHEQLVADTVAFLNRKGA